jgi:steroid 5-alpha reductase family enzyme
MDYLRKSPKVSNHVAILIVAAAAYLSATVTTLIVENMYQRILSLTATTFAAVFLAMALMFALSRLMKRTDLIDVGWGLSFVVAAVVSYLLNPALKPGLNVQTLATLLVIVWASRLSYHIILRLRSKPEDKRYVALRAKWKGNEAVNTFWRIFMVQAALAAVISIGVIHINLRPAAPLDIFTWAGLAVWLVGFGFESIGDWQLRRFLADPKNKGKLMTGGLWRYTRHPNYFGEATLWFGIFIMALGTEYGWVAVITPGIITYLLLFVSGVPLTEKAFAGKSGWARYKKRTSPFLPVPPRKA